MACPTSLDQTVTTFFRPPTFLISPNPGPVGGRLQLYADNWPYVTDDPWILSVVKLGYRLQFDKIPPTTFLPEGPRFHLSGAPLVAAEEAIQKLIHKEAVIELDPFPTSRGFYSPIFLVPKKDSPELRMIIDLKTLNKNFLQKPPTFRMESIPALKLALRPGDWMVSLDLRDAYLHVPIHPVSRKFLRFAVNGRLFEFKVLPFGISIAPWLFTRLTSPAISYLHSQSVRIHGYLDDFLLPDQIRQSLEHNRDHAVFLLEHLGFIIHPDKSDFIPSQKVQYIGAVFDSQNSKVLPPADRVATARSLITSMSQSPQTLRQWMSLLGRLTSLQDLTNRGRLKLRPFQCWINSVRSLELSHTCSPPQDILQTLQWWIREPAVLRGVPLTPFQQDILLVTDASNSGWGAHLENQMIHGEWSPSERKRHINQLELLAILKAVFHWTNVLRGKNIMVASDNSTVVAYINRQGGTRSSDLLKLCQDLFQWVDRYNCQLKARHIPGHLNVLADSLSRPNQIQSTEWSLHPQTFQMVSQLWEVPMLDLFATRLNNKLPVFVSPVPDPQAYAIDALSISWDSLIAYAFPPPALLPAVLGKVRRHSCIIILIAPAWPNRAWFPDLLELSTHPPVELPVFPTLLKQPRSDRFHLNPESLHLHAWRLSKQVSEGADSRMRWHKQSEADSGDQLQPYMTADMISLSPGSVSSIQTQTSLFPSSPSSCST